MKKLIIVFLFLLIFFTINDKQIYAQNKFKIGTVSLIDTIISGKHYLKITSGFYPLGDIKFPDSIYIKSVKLKDSLGNFVINANTIINGSLNFTNTDLTLVSLNTKNISISDSLNIIYNVFTNKLAFNNSHYSGSTTFYHFGTSPLNKFEVLMGDVDTPDSYLRLFKGGKVYIGGESIYINDINLDQPNIMYKNVANTLTGGASITIGTTNIINDAISTTNLSSGYLTLTGTNQNIYADFNKIYFSKLTPYTTYFYNNDSIMFTYDISDGIITYRPLTLNKSLIVNKPISYSVVQVDSVDYTTTENNYMLLMNTGYTNDTVTIVPSVEGQELIIKLISNKGGSVVVIPKTISNTASKIDNENENIIYNQYTTRNYIYRNNKWWIK